MVSACLEDARPVLLLGLGGDLLQGVDEALARGRLVVLAAGAVGAGGVQAPGADQAGECSQLAGDLDAALDLGDRVVADAGIGVEQAFAEADGELGLVHAGCGVDRADPLAFGRGDVEELLPVAVECSASKAEGADGFEVLVLDGSELGQHAADA